MATLLLTGLGTLIGGPLGGALGALAGQQIDQAIIGSKTRQGPRLKELTVQASSYGAAIPRVYGRMRIAGSVIWATDLKEHRDKQGGGKGQPKTVTYSYSSSFAVALSSRPIQAIGRIWADGTLLRGAEGDLKVPGQLRVHRGHGDQQPDPLLAAAEGSGNCPAYRGLAYAVFEDLQLAEFGNRIPSLSFEVIAENGDITPGTILGDLVPSATVASLDHGLLGFTIDGGSIGQAIETIAQAVPVACTSPGSDLLLTPAEPHGGTVTSLPEPAVSASHGEADNAAPFRRRRQPLPQARLVALRYYDVARDYQPSAQQGRGRSLPGDGQTIEFPAALAAPAARDLADAASRRLAQPQDSLTYRVAELDPALGPGMLASLPGSPERWRIDEWEWTPDGIELSLTALPHSSAALQAGGADPGRALIPPDLSPPSTELAAFELPWDGNDGGNRSALFAAASATNSAWKGAALYALQPDGSLVSLGATGRTRALLGSAVDVLPAASPLAIDRASTVEVQLAGPDLALIEASLAQLAMGANRALLGEEIIQFGRAEPLGQGRWRLADLLRGRGGTEAAVAGHAPGERFVVLDEALVSLDPELVGDARHARLAASGLADPMPVTSPFALTGITLRPLSPVHGALESVADGALRLDWTRRARGAWRWADGVDAPLAEQAEAYMVTLGDLAEPLASWEVAEPRLVIPAAAAAQLRSTASGAMFAVRQRGSHALSEPLTLGTLA